VLLYKGRGSLQEVGVATAPRFDGPFTRSKMVGVISGGYSEDPWGWIDPKSGAFHALLHKGNGADSAGVHAWSTDGVHWNSTGVAYTGSVQWRITFPRARLRHGASLDGA